MEWKTLILCFFLMIAYAQLVSATARNKRNRGCFAELKCGGEIKFNDFNGSNQHFYFHRFK